MKKILMVLLVLAVALGGVFAATGDNLILTTSVSGTAAQVGFSNAAIETYAATYSSAQGNNTEIASTALDGYYLYAGTNEAAKFDIKLAATAFSSTTVTTKIGYSFTINGVSFAPTKTVDVAATKVWQLDNASGKTPKAESKQFGAVTLTAADVAIAQAATDYKATLTVTIESAT